VNVYLSNIIDREMFVRWLKFRSRWIWDIFEKLWIHGLFDDYEIFDFPTYKTKTSWDFLKNNYNKMIFESYTQVLGKMINKVLIEQKNIFKKWNWVHKSWENDTLCTWLWVKWKTLCDFAKISLKKMMLWDLVFKKMKNIVLILQKNIFKKWDFVILSCAHDALCKDFE